MDRAKLGKRNKVMGSNAERLYAKFFRELGFSFCKTSRQASRLHDDAGIDLVETTPFNVQIKAGHQRGMNHSNVLSIMKERSIELFPPNNQVNKNINIMVHRKPVGKGKKRNEFDDLVTMSFEDFKELLHKQI